MKYLFILIVILLTACSTQYDQPKARKIIPKPNDVVFWKGIFEIKQTLVLDAKNSKLKVLAENFRNDMLEFVSIKLDNNNECRCQRGVEYIGLHKY